MKLKICLLGLALMCLSAGGKKEYPVPEKKANHLFYIQRTVNTNTIMYTANFDAEGRLKKDEPVKVFWINYADDGGQSELNALEKKFAYGVKHNARNDDFNEFELKLAAYSKVQMVLKWHAPFQAKVYMVDMENQLELDHAFITANNSGLFTRVESIKVFLKEPGSNGCIEKEVYRK
ncbi:DUF4833 domain-containing protein [Puteibacter caeruleilacunae]|nr:DUF4833 domain-containing protein [Puteibacter caeruleilacunae]